MRRPSASDGLLLAFLLNLLLHYPWGLLALLLWILHLWLGIPWFLPLIALGVWVFIALFITVFFNLFAWIGESARTKKSKRNPHYTRDPATLIETKQPVNQLSEYLEAQRAKSQEHADD